jgi:precorrin-2 dehydrogenase / sirohydrochlorin ferrochelatase
MIFFKNSGPNPESSTLYRFPIDAKLSGRQVIVIGGGAVGQRKARKVLLAGAVVTVIDPVAAPFDGVQWISRCYEKTDIVGAFLIFACAPPHVNDQIVEDSQKLGIWVCDASQPERGDFTLPASGQVGGVSVSVSTGGAAPNLAVQLRDEILAALDPAAVALVNVLEKLRPEILTSSTDEAERKKLLREFCSSVWRERLRHEGADDVLQAMRELIPHQKS